MKLWTKAFFAGYLAAGAAESLWQDMLGKEAYIKHVEHGWVAAKYTVPIAIFLLIVAIRWLYQAIIEYDLIDK